MECLEIKKEEKAQRDQRAAIPETVRGRRGRFRLAAPEKQLPRYQQSNSRAICGICLYAITADATFSSLHFLHEYLVNRVQVASGDIAGSCQRRPTLRPAAA